MNTKRSNDVLPNATILFTVFHYPSIHNEWTSEEGNKIKIDRMMSKRTSIGFEL